MEEEEENISGTVGYDHRVDDRKLERPQGTQGPIIDVLNFMDFMLHLVLKFRDNCSEHILMDRN